jgi:hypothetical protein
MSVLLSKTVNELDAMLIILELRRERIDQSVASLKTERQQVADELNKVRQALTKKKQVPDVPTVSAHTLLRYIERVLDIDVELLNNQIISPGNRAAIESGATKITVDGVSIVIRDNVVVTVLDSSCSNFLRYYWPWVRSVPIPSSLFFRL